MRWNELMISHHPGRSLAKSRRRCSPFRRCGHGLILLALLATLSSTLDAAEPRVKWVPTAHAKDADLTLHFTCRYKGGILHKADLYFRQEKLEREQGEWPTGHGLVTSSIGCGRTVSTHAQISATAGRSGVRIRFRAKRVSRAADGPAVAVEEELEIPWDGFPFREAKADLTYEVEIEWPRE